MSFRCHLTVLEWVDSCHILRLEDALYLRSHPPAKFAFSLISVEFNKGVTAIAINKISPCFIRHLLTALKLIPLFDSNLPQFPVRAEPQWAS